MAKTGKRLAVGLVLGLAACGDGPSQNHQQGTEKPMSEQSWPYATLTGEAPLIIAHRGASGYLPEHTLVAYERAIDMGADYIEPDLVLSKDGILVARHDYYLSTTTDVADRPEFADRKRVIDGREDWFTEDFTLKELKTLRVRQAFPGRSGQFDGQYAIPTFDEILALVAEKEAQTGRTIGLYPETKHPAHFGSVGLDFTEPLLDALDKAGRNQEGAAVFIQSFEPEILRDLRPRTPLDLVMLVFSQRELDPGAPADAPSVPLDVLSEFADGVGPFKGLLIDESGQPNGFVDRAHALGLAVHPWTLRDDSLAPGFATPEAEYRFWFSLGVDGIFTDFPDTGLRVRKQIGLQGGNAGR